MPNPLINWTKQSPPPPPPHPSGATKVDETSLHSLLSPTMEGGGVISFQTPKQMPQVVSLPFKVYSPACTPYEEFWSSEQLHVYQIFPIYPPKGQGPNSLAKVGHEAKCCKRTC